MLKPTSLTVEEIHERLRPSTDLELELDYRVDENVNRKDIAEKPHKDERQKSYTTHARAAGGTPVENEVTSTDVNTQEVAEEDESQPRERNGHHRDVEKEYVIERIVDDGINEDPEHPSAQVGETTYRVSWYGYGRDDDTFEPIRHLPRNEVVSYCKRKMKPLPKNLHESMNATMLICSRE